MHGAVDPGEPIDYAQIKRVLGRVFDQWDDAQTTGPAEQEAE